LTNVTREHALNETGSDEAADELRNEEECSTNPWQLTSKAHAEDDLHGILVVERDDDEPWISLTAGLNRPPEMR